MRGTAPLVVSCRWLKPTDRNRTLSFTAMVMGLAIWATMGPPKTHFETGRQTSVLCAEHVEKPKCQPFGIPAMC
jgi:hypothetical protein